MDSRMNKYDLNKMSRVSRNEELYKEINDNELDNFSVRSNATVIGNQEPEIDIEKIKKILDTKYNEAPKRKSIRVELQEEESIIDEQVPTKEYDLNVFLEKAKGDLPETYEEARAKKLRNTQFDILNNLNINSKSEDKEDEQENEGMKKAEEDLMELINTITINESKIKDAEREKGEDVDPLGILESHETDTVAKEMVEEIKNNVTNKIEIKEEKKIDDSFYTKSLFKEKDFESDDFTDANKLNIGVKILIVIVIIAFAIGLFLFLRSFIGF